MSNPESNTLAVVGTAGGVGATRLSVEAAALLAAAGRDALVLDANYATQGLSTYVDDRLDPDVTALVTDPELGVDDAASPLDAPGTPPRASAIASRTSASTRRRPSLPTPATRTRSPMQTSPSPTPTSVPRARPRRHASRLGRLHARGRVARRTGVRPRRPRPRGRPGFLAGLRRRLD
ncbi:hypothetical protein [Halarchaeum nitratireducens]|uniref:hypothetical protein n=1 Tax=Halarchaeum nitratireducens TaxID=489913 RepID=UPI00166ACA4D|nr:hypothetical protein [Halarchaeum nitratireducens]